VDNKQVYQLWLNFKAKKRIITEKKIKGRCELRERHWKMLERVWYAQFSAEHVGIKTPHFLFFLRHYPGIKDENLRRIVCSTKHNMSLTEVRKEA
jgi:hypothetical protein